MLSVEKQSSTTGGSKKSSKVSSVVVIETKSGEMKTSATKSEVKKSGSVSSISSYEPIGGKRGKEKKGDPAGLKNIAVTKVTKKIVEDSGDKSGYLADVSGNVTKVTRIVDEGEKSGYLADVSGNVTKVTEIVQEGGGKSGYLGDVSGNVSHAADSQGRETTSTTHTSGAIDKKASSQAFIDAEGGSEQRVRMVGSKIVKEGNTRHNTEKSSKQITKSSSTSEFRKSSNQQSSSSTVQNLESSGSEQNTGMVGSKTVKDSVDVQNMEKASKKISTSSFSSDFAKSSSETSQVQTSLSTSSQTRQAANSTVTHSSGFSASHPTLTGDYSAVTQSGGNQAANTQKLVSDGISSTSAVEMIGTSATQSTSKGSKVTSSNTVLQGKSSTGTLKASKTSTTRKEGSKTIKEEIETSPDGTTITTITTIVDGHPVKTERMIHSSSPTLKSSTSQHTSSTKLIGGKIVHVQGDSVGYDNITREQNSSAKISVDEGGSTSYNVSSHTSEQHGSHEVESSRKTSNIIGKSQHLDDGHTKVTTSRDVTGSGDQSYDQHDQQSEQRGSHETVSSQKTSNIIQKSQHHDDSQTEIIASSDFSGKADQSHVTKQTTSSIQLGGSTSNSSKGQNTRSTRIVGSKLIPGDDSNFSIHTAGVPTSTGNSKSVDSTRNDVSNLSSSQESYSSSSMQKTGESHVLETGTTSLVSKSKTIVGKNSVSDYQSHTTTADNSTNSRDNDQNRVLPTNDRSSSVTLIGGKIVRKGATSHSEGISNASTSSTTRMEKTSQTTKKSSVQKSSVKESRVISETTGRELGTVGSNQMGGASTVYTVEYPADGDEKGFTEKVIMTEQGPQRSSSVTMVGGKITRRDQTASEVNSQTVVTSSKTIHQSHSSSSLSTSSEKRSSQLLSSSTIGNDSSIDHTSSHSTASEITDKNQSVRRVTHDGPGPVAVENTPEQRPETTSLVTLVGGKIVRKDTSKVHKQQVVKSSTTVQSSSSNQEHVQDSKLSRLEGSTSITEGDFPVTRGFLEPQDFSTTVSSDSHTTSKHSSSSIKQSSSSIKESSSTNVSSEHRSSSKSSITADESKTSDKKTVYKGPVKEQCICEICTCG